MSNQYIKTFDSLNELRAAIKDNSINYWNNDANITEIPLYDAIIVYEKETKSLYFGKYGFFEEVNLRIGNAVTHINFRKARISDVSQYTHISSNDKLEIMKSAKVALISEAEPCNSIEELSNFDPEQFKSKFNYLIDNFGDR